MEYRPSPPYIPSTNRVDTPDSDKEDEEGIQESTPPNVNMSSSPILNRDSSNISIATIEGAEETAVVDDHNPLFVGCRHVDCFEKVRMVDEGTYGVVFAAKNRKTGELVALKKVKLSKEDSNRDGFPITALRETNVLLALQHPNIVSVREMVVGKKMDEVFMVMEYFDNDLKRVLSSQKKRNMQAREDMLGEGTVNKREFDKKPVFKIREVL